MPTTIVSRSFQAITALLFLAVIFLPFLGMSFGFESDLGGIENRKLAELPSFRLTWAGIKRMPNSIEAYFNDHFYLRDSFIWLHNYLLVFGLHASPTPDVIIGKEKWLFYNKDERDDKERVIDKHNGRSLFTQVELDNWVERLQHTQKWLASRNIHFLFVPGPDKMGIYPEYLGLDNSRSKLNQLLLEINEKAPTINILDLYPALLDEKKRHLVYYPYGTHWNDFGAYRSYREIMVYLRRWFPALELISEDEMEFTNRQDADGERDDRGVNDRYGARLIGLPDDFLAEDIHFEPRAPLQGERVDINFPQYYTDSLIQWKRPFAYKKSGKPLSALIFRDSFGRWLVPYLAASFGTTTFVRGPWTIPVLNYWVNKTRPDVVIVEKVERTF